MAQDIAAVCRMGLDDLEFLISEALGLAQDIIRNADLAAVMQERDIIDPVEFFPLNAHLLRLINDYVNYAESLSQNDSSFSRAARSRCADRLPFRSERRNARHYIHRRDHTHQPQRAIRRRYNGASPVLLRSNYPCT